MEILSSENCNTYLERVVLLPAANQAKNKRIICSDNTVHYRMGTSVVLKHRSRVEWRIRYLCLCSQLQNTVHCSNSVRTLYTIIPINLSAFLKG